MRNRHFTVSEQQLLEEIMLLRRDVRGNKFTQENITTEVIEKILMAATLAPSVGFSQPWEFVVIRDKETKQQIANSFQLENKKAEQLFSDDKRQMYNQLKLEGILETPVNIAVFYKHSTQPVLGQTTIKETGEYSVVCAVQNMWLMSRALNIGLGWVSILDPEAVKKILQAPQQNKLVAYLCIGYVKEFLEQPELEQLSWEKRKSIKSVVYRDKYPASDG